MSEEQKFDGDQVPMSVIDKFISLNKANNQAYSEIVSALETLSTNIYDMRNLMTKLSDQIEGEQLAEVMGMCTENIQKQVERITELITQLTDFHCSVRDSELFPALEDNLKVNGITPNDFARKLLQHLDAPHAAVENRELVTWALGILRGVRGRWAGLMVALGATLAFIYFNGGKAIMELITKVK